MNVTPPGFSDAPADDRERRIPSEGEKALEESKSPRKAQQLTKTRSLGTAERIKRYYEVADSPIGSIADTTNIYTSSNTSIRSGPHIPQPVHGSSPLAQSSQSPRDFASRSSFNQPIDVTPRQFVRRTTSLSFNATRAAIVHDRKSPGRSPGRIPPRKLVISEIDNDGEQEIPEVTTETPIPRRNSRGDSPQSRLSLHLPHSRSSSPNNSARSGGSSPTFPTWKQVIVKGGPMNPGVVRLRPLDLTKLLDEQEARQNEQDEFLEKLERIYKNTPRPRSPSYLDIISTRKHPSGDKKRDKVVTIVVDERPSSDRTTGDALDSPPANNIDIEKLPLMKSSKDFDKSLLKVMGLALKNCKTEAKTSEELEDLVLDFAKRQSEDVIKEELNKDAFKESKSKESKSKLEVLGEFFIKESPKAKDILWCVQKGGLLLDHITIRLQVCQKALIKYHDLKRARSDKSLKLYNVLQTLIKADKYLNADDHLEGVTDLVSFIRIIDEEVKKDKELSDFFEILYRVFHPDKKTAENVLGTLRKWADSKSSVQLKHPGQDNKKSGHDQTVYERLKQTVHKTSIHFIKLATVPYTEHSLTKSENIKSPDISTFVHWLVSDEIKNKIFINGQEVSCRIEKKANEKKPIDLKDETTRILQRLLRVIHLNGFENDETVKIEYITKKAEFILKGELPKYAELLCLCMPTKEQIDGCLKQLYPALYESPYLACIIKEIPEVECHININSEPGAKKTHTEVTQVFAYGIYARENTNESNSIKINPAKLLCTLKIVRTVSPEDNRESILIADVVMNDKLVAPEERYKIEEILINWADPGEKFINDLEVIQDSFEQAKFNDAVEKYLERVLKGVNFFNPSVYSMTFGIVNLCRQRVESLGSSNADMHAIVSDSHSNKIKQIAKEVVDSIQVENSGVLLDLIIKGLELLSRELQDYLKLKGTKTEMCEKLMDHLRDLIASNKYLKEKISGKRHLGSFLKILTRDIKDKTIKNIIFFALKDTSYNPLTVLDELQKWHGKKAYKTLIPAITRMIQDYQLMDADLIKTQKHVFQESANAEYLIRKIKFQEILRNVEDKHVLFKEVKVNGIPLDLEHLETTDDVRCDYFTRLLYNLQEAGLEIFKIDKNTYSELDAVTQKVINRYVIRIKELISEGKGVDLIDNGLTSDEVKWEYLTRVLFNLQAAGINLDVKIVKPKYKELDVKDQLIIKGYIDRFKELISKDLAYDLRNLEPTTDGIRREYLMRLIFKLYRAGVDPKIRIDKPTYEELDEATKKILKGYVDRILTFKSVPYEQMISILTAEPILCIPLLLISTNSAWLMLDTNMRKRFPELYNDIRINPWSEGGIICNYVVNEVTGQGAVELIRQYAVYRKIFPELADADSTTINRDRCLAMITFKGTFTPKDPRYWFQPDQEKFPTLCSSCLEVLDLDIKPIANTEEKWRIKQALLEFENETSTPERKTSTPRDKESPRTLVGLSPRTKSQMMSKIPRLPNDTDKR